MSVTKISEGDFEIYRLQYGDFSMNVTIDRRAERYERMTDDQEALAKHLEAVTIMPEMVAVHAGAVHLASVYAKSGEDAEELRSSINSLMIHSIAYGFCHAMGIDPKDAVISDAQAEDQRRLRQESDAISDLLLKEEGDFHA